MSRFPTFKESLTQVISLPSVSSTDPSLDQSNQAVIDYLANCFEDLGFAVEQLAVEGTPGKSNLLARLGEGEGGLLLSGHTDTVPTNAEQWQQDPFNLTEKGDRFYGLGVADMKSFFPIIMETIKELDINRLAQPVFILATADEESTMSGARALAASGRPLGRHALIGEPTSLRPIYMHKGILMEAIRLRGESGHSSNPSLGRNAIEGMHRIIEALIAWRGQLQEGYVNEHFEVPFPTLNFGSIKGGDNPNRICAQCELQIDLRFLPTIGIEDIRAELHQVVQEAVKGMGLKLEFIPIFGGVPALQTNTDSEIVSLAEELTGKSAGTVAFGTEAPFLSKMGMETVILGPGSIDQAHRPDEYLEIKTIEPMKGILKGLINNLCIKENHGVSSVS